MLIPKKNRKEVYKHLFKGELIGDEVFVVEKAIAARRRRRSAAALGS